MTATEPRPDRASSEAGAAPLLRARALDHVNLHVRDADAALQFYTDILGLAEESVDRDEQGRATFVVLRAGPQQVFLMRRPQYQAPGERNQRGLNHICVEIEPADPQQLLADLRARGVTLRSDIVRRQSERGPTLSIYVEDLDGHGVEIKQYAR
jgi:catechol 2,3-dioxygenase-like lactoylglutathione lyase family enzyme